jgi:hypothetical protein
LIHVSHEALSSTAGEKSTLSFPTKYRTKDSTSRTSPSKRRSLEGTAYIGGGKFVDILSIGLLQVISAQFGQKRETMSMDKKAPSGAGRSAEWRRMWTSVQKDKCHPMDMGLPLARIISHYWYVDIFPSGNFCPFWAKKGEELLCVSPPDRRTSNGRRLAFLQSITR